MNRHTYTHTHTHTHTADRSVLWWWCHFSNILYLHARLDELLAYAGNSYVYVCVCMYVHSLCKCMILPSPIVAQVVYALTETVKFNWNSKHDLWYNVLKCISKLWFAQLRWSSGNIMVWLVGNSVMVEQSDYIPVFFYSIAACPVFVASTWHALRSEKGNHVDRMVTMFHKTTSIWHNHYTIILTRPSHFSPHMQQKLARSGDEANIIYILWDWRQT